MFSKTVLHFSIAFFFGLLITVVIDHTSYRASDFWWWAEVFLILGGMVYNLWTRPIEGTRLPKLLGLLAGAIIGVILIKAFFWYDSSGLIR